MSDIDFVVLDLDGGAMLESCVESILLQTLPPSKVIVLDNGSRTPAAGRLARRWPAQVEVRGGATQEKSDEAIPIVVLRSDVNLGFAAGVNAAVAESSAAFVALVNNDVVLDADWAETVRAAFGERDAAIQTVLRRDAESIDGAGIDTSDGTFRQLGFGSPADGALPVAWGVSATAALFRRELLDFDPSFFAYYEDVELSARLHDGGWETRVLPVAKASHRGSASASVLGGRALYLRTRNRYFVARLHRGVGRIGALLAEDLRLLLRGRASLRGIIAGLTSSLHDARAKR